MTTAERLTELMIKVTEVSVDVKHLLTRQDETGDRIEKMDDRLRVVEQMRGKLLGIAFLLPIVITIGIAAIGRFYG